MSLGSMHFSSLRSAEDDSEALKAVNALIAAEANLDKRDTFSDWTALHCAAYYGYPGTVEALIQARANLDVPDEKGWTALRLALSRGHNTIADILVKAGANLNLPDNQGSTMLHSAATTGNTNLVDILIKAGADLDVHDSHGWTALRLALCSKHTTIALKLIAAGAKIINDPKNHTSFIENLITVLELINEKDAKIPSETTDEENELKRNAIHKLYKVAYAHKIELGERLTLELRIIFKKYAPVSSKNLFETLEQYLKEQAYDFEVLRFPSTPPLLPIMETFRPPESEEMNTLLKNIQDLNLSVRLGS